MLAEFLKNGCDAAADRFRTRSLGLTRLFYFAMQLCPMQSESGPVVEAEKQRRLGAGLGFGDKLRLLLFRDGREVVREVHVLF